jgi:urease accessory protein
VLTGRRFRLPLQALEPMDLDGSGGLTLALLNPTGGVLAGDVLEARVRLGAGSRVCLTTPSATRVYRSPGAPAVQRLDAVVEDGAALEYVPDHLIPSPGARLQQATRVWLGEEATLLLADGWAVGRLARGEAWRFGRLDLALDVADRRGLLLRERVILEGHPRAPDRSWDGLGAAEGAGYLGTFVAANPSRQAWEALCPALEAAVAEAAPAVRAGASPLGRGGLLVRVLAPSAPALQAALACCWARCRRGLLDLPPLGLRKL